MRGHARQEVAWKTLIPLEEVEKFSEKIRFKRHGCHFSMIDILWEVITGLLEYFSLHLCFKTVYAHYMKGAPRYVSINTTNIESIALYLLYQYTYIVYFVYIFA